MAVPDGPEIRTSQAETAPASDQVIQHGHVRATWGGKVEFMLSAIGYAVGLGNVWRFPYLCYVNGGGAFLIPYVLMLALCGVPLFFLELAIGQFASLGPISIWKLCPMFKGIGYTSVVAGFIVGTYYNVIIAFTLFYFFASFAKELPWSRCGNTWNTELCLERTSVPMINATVSNTTLNATIWNWTTLAPPVSEEPRAGFVNCSVNVTSKTPAEEYWERYVLDQSDGIEHLGSVRWHLALCLLLAWIIVFLCIIKGIKSSGKVVYFTATFPYVVLFILFIRGVTLPGAGKGILYYITPDFRKMGHAKVWKDAAVQILYSLGVGGGALITMGSFNKFGNNCYKDALTVSITNCATSVFAGFVIFSVVGFMAETSHVAVDAFVKTGPGLAFVVYPEALSMMWAAPFWSILFFFMLFTLGLDSQFAGMECVMTGLADEFQFVRERKTLFTLGTCVVMYLIGLMCVTQGGMYVIQLMDRYATAFPLLVVTGLEAAVISWIYGLNRFSDDIMAMTGTRPNIYWKACWGVAAPLLTLLIMIFYCIEYRGIVEDCYTYPTWAEGLGWLMSLAALSMIPLWMIIKVCQCIGSCQNCMWVLRGPTAIKSMNLQTLWRPRDDWGPALQINKDKREHIGSSNVLVNESEVENFASPGTGYGVLDDSSYI